MLYKIQLDNLPIYVALPESKDVEGMLQPSSGLKRMLKIVSIMNWVLFIGILVVVFLGRGGSSKDSWKLVFFPLIGISFAWTVFVDRSFELLAKYLYKYKLRQYEKKRKLVIIPTGLLAQTHKICEKLDVKLFDVLFDYDLSKTRKLCRLYQKNRRSPEVKNQLEELIHNVPQPTKQKVSPPIIFKYELQTKGISNLLYYLSSLIGL